MDITIIEAPAGQSPAVLAHQHRFIDGSLTAAVRPTDHTSGNTALTLLEGLGKDLTRGGGRAARQAEFRTWLPAWLHAHSIRDVILTGPQNLDSRNLTWTLRMLQDVDRVVLACHYRTSHELRVLARKQGHDLFVSTWDDWWDPDVAATGPPPTPTGALVSTEDLPRSDFLTFRHNFHKTLSPDQAASLDATYVTAFKATGPVTPTPGAVAEHLQAQFGGASTSADLIAVVRATQAALFARGHLLTVDLDRLFRILGSTHPAISDEHWHAANWLLDPQSAAIAALFLLDLPMSTFADLTVDDVTTALRDGSLAGRHIPHLARPLLLAHLYQRGGQATQPYLTRVDYHPVLARARKHLGLPIAQTGYASFDKSRLARPLSQIGLNLRSLT